MLVAFQGLVNRIEKHFIGHVAHGLTGVVQIGDNSCAWLFDQITNDLVIEIINLDEILFILNQ
jgi:hypothetical protein